MNMHTYLFKRATCMCSRRANLYLSLPVCNPKGKQLQTALGERKRDGGGIFSSQKEGKTAVSCDVSGLKMGYFRGIFTTQEGGREIGYFCFVLSDERNRD